MRGLFADQNLLIFHIRNGKLHLFHSLIRCGIAIPDKVNRAVGQLCFFHIPINRLPFHLNPIFLKNSISQINIKACISAIFLLKSHGDKGIIKADCNLFFLLVLAPVIQAGITDIGTTSTKQEG